MRAPSRSRLSHPWRCGFSLLEVAVALAVLGIIAGAITPLIIQRARDEAARQSAREMLALLDAAKNFYVSQPINALRWPEDLAELQADGFVPGDFSGITRFGTAYGTSSNPATFSVRAIFPTAIAPGIARALPFSAMTAAEGGTEVAASVPAPGLSADLSQVLHRAGTGMESTMYGPLKIEDGTQGQYRVLMSDADGVGRWRPLLAPDAVIYFARVACPEGWSDSAGALPPRQGLIACRKDTP